MKTGIIIMFVLVAFAIILIAPMVFLWVINSLSEAGGASFYITHNAYNYFVSFIALAMLGSLARN